MDENLKQTIDKLVIRMSSIDIDDIRRDTSAVNSSEPQLEGWLYKWTNYIKLYQKRWFVLRQNSLSYYRSPSETSLTCRGIISLVDAIIQAEEGNNFVVSHGNQAYHLKANNEIERQRWIMMLELAKSRQYLNEAGNHIYQGTLSSLSNQSNNSTSTKASSIDWSKDDDQCSTKPPIENRHSYNIIDKNNQSLSTNANKAKSYSLVHSGSYQYTNSTHLDNPNSLETSNQVEPAIETTSEDDEDDEYLDKKSPIRDILESSTKDLSKKLVNLKQQALLFNESISLFANSLVPLCTNVKNDLRKTSMMEYESHCLEKQTVLSSTSNDLLQTSTSTKVLNDQQRVLSEILKNVAKVQESLDILSNSSSIYVEAAETHQKIWIKSIVKEHSNRIKLEDLVEQLARQQSEYEEEFFDAEEGSNQDPTNSNLNKDSLLFTISPTLRSTRLPLHNDVDSMNRKLSSCMRSKSKSLESRLSDDIIIDNNGNDKCTKSDNFLQHLKDTNKQIFIIDHSSDNTVDMSGRINQCSSEHKELSHSDHVEMVKNDMAAIDVDIKELNTHESSTNNDGHENDVTIKADQTVMVKKHRTTIPFRLNQSLNLWSILKNCMGKELTKIPIPVNFNEPLSMLQRLTEDYEYADELLHPAAKLTDPLEQMVYVAIFAVSSYSTTSNRTGKPFNPLLGETYECDRMDDLGWKCINEQVGHHPPMMASYCQGHGWVSWREFGMSSKFRGKYLQVTPQDFNCLEIGNNIYTWKKVDTCVHNIIVGKLWVDHEGEMVIINHTTGDQCRLKFWPYSYFSREVPKKVSGFVFDKNDRPQWLIDGTWDHSMKFSKVISSSIVNGSQTVKTTDTKILWQRRHPGPEYEKMYNMTQFAIQLNEPEDKVAPTDSRLRPDQRLMEIGKWDESNKVKCQLEEKQRSARRIRETVDGMDSKNYMEKLIMKDTSNSMSKKKEEGLELAEDHQYRSDDNTNGFKSATNYSLKDGNRHNGNSALDGPFWFKKSFCPIAKKTVHKYSNEYWQCKERGDWSRCPDIF